MKAVQQIKAAVAAIALASLCAGAQAALKLDLNATLGMGPFGGESYAGTQTVSLDAGVYNVSVIDNTANGGYAGWTFNTAGRVREAFSFSVDGGATVYSVDVVSANNKFTDYATSASALSAFATGPYAVYQGALNTSTFDATLLNVVPQLQITLNAPTAVRFGIPDNLFSDNTGGVSLAITAVPEPATQAMLLAGLAAVGGIVVARRRANAA